MSRDPAAATPTPLARKLASLIARAGPWRVNDYMQACLLDPDYGYYRRRAALGREGDFITAPEISQVFGELIGLWCAVVWQQMGSPRAVRLIELGPGRGTLMRDMLRAVRAVPGFHAALNVCLVETNATLAGEQQAALADADVPVTWTTALNAGASDVPAIVIGNEFLDTLPVAQWVLAQGQWRARCVGVARDGRLCFIEGEPDPDLRLPPEIAATAREGDVFETRTPLLEGWAAQLAALSPTLAALFIDYGHVTPVFGETLQAVREHRYADPLIAPGETDLTAQVDFAAVAAAMRSHGLACDGPNAQAEFLGVLGIAARASRLMHANPERAGEIETAIARLMAPGGMGTRFKAIGVRSPGLAPLPGLTPVDTQARYA
jgi:NADH dehydrogenase [ubiquinone] 1 alpha subcomplex assembly factor 7